MATNNIKIFDENKSNMLSNEAYGVNSQRLNGVQQGIASSQLQNKTLYQVSLVAYAIGQMMQANGFDANDELAVSAFCDNMSKSIMQKTLDLVSVGDVTKFEDTKKYINPATWKAAFDFMKADSSLIQSGTDDTHFVTPKGVKEALSLKCEIVVGSYTGDGKSTRAIKLGFAPKAVFLIRKDGITYDSTKSDGYYGGLATPGMPCVANYDSNDYREEMFRVTDTGFTVHTGRFVSCNYSSVVFYYLAVK